MLNIVFGGLAILRFLKYLAKDKISKIKLQPYILYGICDFVLSKIQLNFLNFCKNSARYYHKHNYVSDFNQFYIFCTVFIDSPEQ